MKAALNNALYRSLLAAYHRYGPELNRHDVIKGIAILSMVVDHVGAFFLPDQPGWRVAGRVAAPIFFFLIGYAPSDRQRKTLWRLGVLMIVADILMQQAVFPLNILMAILCCRFFLPLAQKAQTAYDNFFLLAIALLAVHPIAERLVEYGACGFAFVIAGDYQRHYPKSTLSRVALLFALSVYGVEMCYVFPFNRAQSAVLLVDLIALALALSQFRHQVLVVPHAYRPAANLVMFLGRNSLYVYVVHYLLFEAVYFMMKPPAPFQLIWWNN